jgi:hypothetical protein
MKPNQAKGLLIWVKAITSTKETKKYKKLCHMLSGQSISFRGLRACRLLVV